jgi:hypothetical protein
VSVAPDRDGGTTEVNAYASLLRVGADVLRAQWAEIPGLASHAAARSWIFW